MKSERALTSYTLMFLLLFQALGALPAGLALIADPSGAQLSMTPDMLRYSPFPNFLIPGLFLFLILGVFPSFIFYGLLKKPDSKLAEKINIYPQYHWSWTFAYFFGLLLIMWINMQLLFLKEWHLLHFIYSTLGVLIVLIAQLPATRDYYRIKETF